MDSPLHVTIYDRDLVRTGWVEDFVEHTVFPRHLALPTATLSVPTDYRILPALAEKGARAVIELERDGQSEVVMSGKIRGLVAEGGPAGVTTFDIEDDFRLFYNLLGFPVPGSWQADATGAITQTGAKSDDRTGPAETVVKGYLSANLARWVGRTASYYVVPTQGRGATLTVDGMRMTPLAEKLLPLLEASGVGFSVRQATSLQGTQYLRVDAYATQTFPIELSEEAGTVEAWKVTKTPYSGTAAVIGGPNTGTSREFRTTRDAAREAVYLDVIETFVDATDQTIAAKILAKGTDALAQLDDKWGVELTLTESSIFRYGGKDGVHVGDRVAVDFPVEIPPITASIGEAELGFNLDDGYTAKFTVGQGAADVDDVNADLLEQIISSLHEIRAG